jgi:CRP-like cAMP-binding protein
MLAGLSIRMHQLVQDIEMLSLQSCTQRFIGYILQISADDADDADADSITLPASKTTIASLLNLTPETLSRTMTKLQQAGLIEVNGKDIVISNIAKLREFEMGI